MLLGFHAIISALRRKYIPSLCLNPFCYLVFPFIYRKLGFPSISFSQFKTKNN